MQSNDQCLPSCRSAEIAEERFHRQQRQQDEQQQQADGGSSQAGSSSQVDGSGGPSAEEPETGVVKVGISASAGLVLCSCRPESPPPGACRFRLPLPVCVPPVGLLWVPLGLLLSAIRSAQQPST